MSKAADNRGTRRIAAYADAAMPAVHARADRQAHKDENERLRAQVAKLERDLARARRCIAELRRSKEERVAEARAERSSSAFAIETLCKRAFGVEMAS